MSHPAAARRLLLGASALCVAAAAGLSWQYAHRPSAAFEPPAEDVCLVPPARQSVAHPYDPASGLEIFAARPVTADARCPVCGMYPARSPRWAAQALYRDGHVHFFDSPIDLFQFMADVPRYSPGRSASDILSTWVTDAPSSRWVAAEQAWYVHGSDALGPMRMGDLPAFASRDEAAGFARQRGGQVLAHDAITPAIVKSLSVERSHALHQHQ